MQLWLELLLLVGVKQILVIDFMEKIRVSEKLVEAPKRSCFRFEQESKYKLIFLLLIFAWKGHSDFEFIIGV